MMGQYPWAHLQGVLRCIQCTLSLDMSKTQSVWMCSQHPCTLTLLAPLHHCTFAPFTSLCPCSLATLCPYTLTPLYPCTLHLAPLHPSNHCVLAPLTPLHLAQGCEWCKGTRCEGRCEGVRRYEEHEGARGVRGERWQGQCDLDF